MDVVNTQLGGVAYLVLFVLLLENLALGTLCCTQDSHWKPQMVASMGLPQWSLLDVHKSPI